MLTNNNPPMLYRILCALLISGFFLACSSSDPAPAAAPADAQTSSEPAAPAYENLPPEEFAGRIGAPNTVLLDVRTPAETAGGVITGALELDFRSADFAAEVAALDKDKTYLVYCASGGRSGKTCEMMEAAGFKNVVNLKGGYRAWTE